MNIKKTLKIIITSVILGLSLSSPICLAKNLKVKCIITGYYSPIPEQQRYVRGTLVGDKRLNGNGTNGADGTQVYTGMIAAPKSIPFGTKIDIPNYGIGTVHDRGGAIVSYSDQNEEIVYRFDIWLGSGDEGLLRALNLGVKKSTCTIYGIDNSITETITLNEVKLPKNWGQSNKTLTITDKGDNVKKLQENLQELGYFNDIISGYFGPITNSAVIDFQLDQKIISSKTSFGSGNVGPKTRAALKKALLNNVHYNKKIKNKKTITNNIKTGVDENSFLIASGIGKNSNTKEIKILQQLLKQYRYYDGKITGIYDIKTINAVIKFQKEQGVIQDENEYGAGFFGKKTNLALIALLNTGIILPTTTQKTNNSIIAKINPMSKNEKTNNTVFKKSLFRIKSTNKYKFKKAMFVYSENKIPDFKKDIYTGIISKGAQNQTVKTYQNKLIALGYLESEPTGYFGPLTEEAIYNFQKDQLLVGNRKSLGAGQLGPKTKSKLILATQFKNKIAKNQTLAI